MCDTLKWLTNNHNAALSILHLWTLYLGDFPNHQLVHVGSPRFIIMDKHGSIAAVCTH